MSPDSERSAELVRVMAQEITCVQNAIVARDTPSIECHTAKVRSALCELRSELQGRPEVDPAELSSLRQRIESCSAVIRRVRGTVSALIGFHRTVAAEIDGIVEAGR